MSMTSSKLSELKKAVNLERLNDGDVKTLIECLELAITHLEQCHHVYDGVDTLAEIESKLGGGFNADRN